VVGSEGGPRRALVVGEALIDSRPTGRVVAGAPVHVAAQLRVLGWEVWLLSAIGRDADGDWVAETLDALGVGTRLLQRAAGLPTPVADVRADGSFGIATLGAFGALEVPPDLPPHELLVWSPLVGWGEGGLARLGALLERTRAGTRVFDVNLRPPYVDRAVLRCSIQAATLVKTSRHETPTVLEALGVPASEGLGGCFARAEHLRALCESAGDEGARLLLADGGELAERAYPVEVVDEVGAGDALTAGLAHAFALALEPGAALRLGLERSAGVLSQPGGLPLEAPLEARRLAGVAGPVEGGTRP
jgi:fructokinase